jgi:GGDEF domain-containing protein
MYPSRKETAGAKDEPSVAVILSCGIASYPECGDKVNELVAHADINLYLAKAAGGGTLSCVEPANLDETMIVPQ